jgi:hypothetical protein
LFSAALFFVQPKNLCAILNHRKTSQPTASNKSKRFFAAAHMGGGLAFFARSQEIEG